MNNDWKIDVFYLQGLLQQTYINANDSYETLRTYEGNTKYQIAVNFLSMSYQSYLVASQFYHSNTDIQREEFDNYFLAYEDFKFEMNRVIVQKDPNTLLMIRLLDQIHSSIVEVNKLIENIQGSGTR